MNYIPVIGLEVHTQLKTNTKIFCGCKNEFGAKANTLVCPVCLGLPGSLPVLNEKVIEYVIKAGLACHCSIAKISKQDRKNYFYPDLPKAYQISQFDQPVCQDGYVEITLDGQEKKIGVTRIHIEEDAGKLIHEEKGEYSFVDYNRTGVPLAEIVSEPDMHSPEEAYEYLKEIKAILEYLEISDCNMQEGSLRCDANVSIMPEGAKEFGTKAEIKNMNSFKGVQKAVEYEINRQIKVVEAGQKVVQETRLWDVDREVTVSMRSKEEAHDYRYFPEPDILTIFIEDTQSIEKSLPELPRARRKRFIEEYQIPAYDAGVLTADKALADYYEQTVGFFNKPKVVSNWVMGELLKQLKQANLSISQSRISAEDLADLLKKIDSGIISQQNAKDVFEEIFSTGKRAEEIIKEKGLEQINDESEIENLIKEIIEQNPKSVEEYKQGKKKALGFLIGQVMYKTKGKANPKIVNQILIKRME